MIQKAPIYKNNLCSYKYNSRNSIQQNIELRLNTFNGALLTPPLLVEQLTTPLQPQSGKHLRELAPKDGLFYYSTDKPPLGLTSHSIQAKKRNLRMLICVTVYSETQDELMDTLLGIYQNIEQFDRVGICNEDIAVVVIFDGCKAMHPSMKHMLQKEDFFKNSHYSYMSLAERIKIFNCEYQQSWEQEYSNNSMFLQQQTLYIDKRSSSAHNFMNIYYGIKLSNAGKLSSHMWFFRGFCELFQPFYCCLVDCGTIPAGDSIFQMFVALEGDNQIGGCCGYMSPYLGDIKQLEEGAVYDWHQNRLDEDSVGYQRGGDGQGQGQGGGDRESNEQGIQELYQRQRGQMDMPTEKSRVDAQYYKNYDWITKMMLKWFCVQKAQQFEYATSHLFDKSFESLFGFVHVLPGAYSAYRWDVLRKRQPGLQIPKNNTNYVKSIIDEEYLVSVLDPDFKSRPEYNIKKANMYLAEDRILCLEIFTKANYILKYIPDSECYTDSVKWINGTWFALFYVLQTYRSKIQRSSHTCLRKMFLIPSMVYAYMNALNTYCLIGFYFVFLWMILKTMFNQYNWKILGPLATLDTIMIFSYMLAVLALFFISMFYSKPERKAYMFSFASSILGLYLLFQFLVFVYIVVIIYFFPPARDNPDSPLKPLEVVALQMKYLIAIGVLSYAIVCSLNLKKSLRDILCQTKDYIYYSPAYFHTLLIFAFCNVDDLSWGTKGLEDNANRHQEMFLDYKVGFLSRWLLTNMGIAFVGSILISNPGLRNYVLLSLGYYFTLILLIRTVGAILEFFKYYYLDKLLYLSKVNSNIPEYRKASKNHLNYLQRHVFGRNSHSNKRLESVTSMVQMPSQVENQNVINKDTQEDTHDFFTQQIQKIQQDEKGNLIEDKQISQLQLDAGAEQVQKSLIIKNSIFNNRKNIIVKEKNVNSDALNDQIENYNIINEKGDIMIDNTRNVDQLSPHRNLILNISQQMKEIDIDQQIIVSNTNITKNDVSDNQTKIFKSIFSDDKQIQQKDERFKKKNTFNSIDL